MTESQSLRQSVERALAFAYAAVDDPTAYRILEAQRYADQVLPRLQQLKPPAFTLTEAKRMVALVGQLRALLSVLDDRLAPPERPRPAN